jgi:hypothetical protein
MLENRSTLEYVHMNFLLVHRIKASTVSGKWTRDTSVQELEGATEFAALTRKVKCHVDFYIKHEYLMKQKTWGLDAEL